MQLTKAEAVAFQQYLIDRFGLMGEHFGIQETPPDLELVDDVVELPTNAGWTFLVPEWRLENDLPIAEPYNRS